MHRFVIVNVLIVLILHGSYATEDQTVNQGIRTAVRIYDECSKSDGGFVSCLKKKAITFLDRITTLDAINIGDEIKVIRTDNAIGQRALSENELEANLPRAIDDRETMLTSMLIDRIVGFMNGHTVQINFPKISSDEIGRSIEEGRGKMKKMMGMMMMGMAMKLMGLIPVAIAALYVLAGKALIVSKIALLLALIVGLKKILSGRGGGGGGGGWSSGSSGWSSGGNVGGWSSGGGHGSGWDRRSMDDAQNLAYRAYSKEQ